MDPNKEAARLFQEIESQYPPNKASMEEYRDVLEALGHEVAERVNQLDEEIGVTET